MSNENLSQKIDELEKIIPDSSTPELDFMLLEQWRKQLQKSEHYKSFLEHPITKEIVESLVKWIKEINGKALNFEGTEKEKWQRECYMRLLRVFGPDKTKLISLENFVDYKLKEFRQ